MLPIQGPHDRLQYGVCLERYRAASAMTAYGAQLQGLYSANVPTVNLTLAVLALVWVAYDYWQEVKA